MSTLTLDSHDVITFINGPWTFLFSSISRTFGFYACDKVNNQTKPGLQPQNSPCLWSVAVKAERATDVMHSHSFYKVKGHKGKVNFLLRLSNSSQLCTWDYFS